MGACACLCGYMKTSSTNDGRFLKEITYLNKLSNEKFGLKNGMARLRSLASRLEFEPSWRIIEHVIHLDEKESSHKYFDLINSPLPMILSLNKRKFIRKKKTNLNSIDEHKKREII